MLLEAKDLYPQLMHRTDGSSTPPHCLLTGHSTGWVGLFVDGEDEVCSRSIPAEVASKQGWCRLLCACMSKLITGTGFRIPISFLIAFQFKD